MQSAGQTGRLGVFAVRHQHIQDKLKSEVVLRFADIRESLSQILSKRPSGIQRAQSDAHPTAHDLPAADPRRMATEPDALELPYDAVSKTLAGLTGDAKLRVDCNGTTLQLRVLRRRNRRL
jgi:hypothetical protein